MLSSPGSASGSSLGAGAHTRRGMKEQEGAKEGWTSAGDLHGKRKNRGQN